jgi:nitrate reductase gamma subunit
MMLDRFFLGVFPYLALAIAIVGTWARVRHRPETVSARSSQLLEARLQRVGSLAWHVPILVILAAHLVAAVAPGAMGRLLGSPVRLYVLEVSGLALGALAVAGLAVLAVRRLGLKIRTSPLDGLVLGALLVQAGTGLWIGYSLRWGSGWYLHTAAPWLASLVRLEPEIGAMAVLPPLVKVHAIGAFVLLALVPFTRLLHAFVWPVGYLWRAPQLVLWRRPRGAGEGVR